MTELEAQGAAMIQVLKYKEQKLAAATSSLEQAKATAEHQSQALADAVAARHSAEAGITQLQADAQQQAREMADAVSAKEAVESALQEGLKRLEAERHSHQVRRHSSRKV